jgi:phenylpropionate dioxygenase-like ring-hydroxylating dioxygenase large terminal subunit
MPSLSDTRVFNRTDRLVEGWYWAERSAALRPGRTCALTFLGKDLVLYRSHRGKVVALDAYCPHMGAHLAEGSVEGEQIRCFFHRWKFNPDGTCAEIPCEPECSRVKPLAAWPVREAYGLIWIWTGTEPRTPIPYVPELGEDGFSFTLGKAFTKDCHPNVVMVNAIDEQHFASVHRLPVDLRMTPTELGESCILFSNTKPIPDHNRFGRFLKRFYREAGTYQLSYWFGTTGTVTLGPDFLHFHILFALRPTADGRTEGQTVLLTKRRRGLFGAFVSRVLLALAQVASSYFASGDTKVFRSIRFNLKHPVRADRSVVSFIRHLERQRLCIWGFGEPERNEQQHHQSHG